MEYPNRPGFNTDATKERGGYYWYVRLMQACGVSIESVLTDANGNREIGIDMTIAMLRSPHAVHLNAVMGYGEERSIVYNLHKTAREADPAAYARWRADVDAARTPAPAAPSDPDAELEEARRRWEALDARLALSAFWADCEAHWTAARLAMDIEEEEDGFLLTPWIPSEEYETWLDSLYPIHHAADYDFAAYIEDEEENSRAALTA